MSKIGLLFSNILSDYFDCYLATLDSGDDVVGIMKALC